MQGFLRWNAKISLGAALIGGLLLQLGLPALDTRLEPLVVMACINIILAVSLNFIMGETGQFSLCHAAFMAVGAYASAACSSFLLPVILGPAALASGSWLNWLLYPMVLLGGAVAAALAGLLIGMPSLRLRGDYLAIVTLGFGEIVRVLLQNFTPLGGAKGLAGIAPATTVFWSVGSVAVTLYLLLAVLHSTYGRGFRAVRDDEVAAEAMGIHTTRFKVRAFVMGAFFAGLAGGLYAHWIGFISPEAFTFQKSIEIVVMVILGGLGSTVGAVGAAILLTCLNEILRGMAEYRMILYALLIIFLMILRPQGLLGGWGKTRKVP